MPKCTYSLRLSKDVTFERMVADYVKFTTPEFKAGAIKIAEDDYDVYLGLNDVRAHIDHNIITFSVRYDRYLEQVDRGIKAFSEHSDYCELI